MAQALTIKNNTLRFLDIHVSEVKNYPNALHEIAFDRKFEGIIIRQVFTEELMKRVVERLENNEGDMNSIWISKMAKESCAKAPYMYGQSIIGSEPDLKKYYACSSAFRQGCRILFQGHPDFEEKVESVFYNLSDGRPIQIPTSLEGDTYTPATIRVLPDNHEIDLHVGNDFPDFPESSHLKTLINVTDQLSYFIPMSLPKAGGELIVYNLECQTNDEIIAAYHLDDSIMDKYESIVLKPNLGDMVLFDGGRYYHRVTPIVGDNPRRTIGGFLAFSSQEDRVYYWS